MWHAMKLVATAIVTFCCSLSPVLADSVAVGTDLCLCGGGPDLLPQELIAQTFSVPSTITATNIFFVIGTYSTGSDNFASPVDYGTLTFSMQLTNSIGPATTPSNVVASASFTLPTSSTTQYDLLSLPLDQVLTAGTYYLVASTPTGIPNSTSLLALPDASNYYTNVGQELTANAGTNVGDMLNGCSPTATINCGFPPASTWIPDSGPAQTAPMEFQVCSQDEGNGCGFILDVAPLPAALPLFASGLGAIGLFGRRRKRRNLASPRLSPNA